MAIPLIGMNLAPVPSNLLPEAGVVAERAGYESVWLGEHLIVPVQAQSEYPAGTQNRPFDQASPFLDPMLVLANVAAVTERVRLGIGVYLMPMRHPIIAAKQFVTLDHLSRGRLDFAYGIGWLEEEFEVLDVSFKDRGRRLDSALELFDRLFHDEVTEYESADFSVSPISFLPKPLAGPPRSRILGGGQSKPAFRRAARFGGWHGLLSTVGPADLSTDTWDIDAVRGFASWIRQEREANGLDGENFIVSGIVTTTPPLDALEQLAAAGVDRLIVSPWERVNGSYLGIATSLDPAIAYAEEIGLADAGR